MKPNCHCAYCRNQRESAPAAHSAPEPTSLIDRIAGRTLPTAPAYNGGPNGPTVASAHAGVPEPPSLIDAIAANRLTAAQRRRK